MKERLPSSRSRLLVPRKISSMRKKSGSAPASLSLSCPGRPLGRPPVDPPLIQRLQQRLEPFDLRIEIGDAVGDRVADFDAGEEAEEIGLKQGRVDRPAGKGQRQVDAQRLEKGALAGHVGAGEDDDLAQVIHGEVVADLFVVGQERMAQSGGGEYRRFRRRIRWRVKQTSGCV